jgi:hypothetical protein
MSNQFKNFLVSHGILHHVSCPHTPQQNGVAKHKHHHIIFIFLFFYLRRKWTNLWSGHKQIIINWTNSPQFDITKQTNEH